MRLFIFLSLIFSFSVAFGRTEIKGKLENCHSCKVSLIIDQSDFDAHKRFFPSKPDQFGNFVFDLGDILQSKVVILEVNAKRFPVYVEPNKQVWLSVSRSGDTYSINYTKGLVAENLHLQTWANKNGWVGDKISGNIWFENNRVGIQQYIYNEFKTKPEFLRVDYVFNFYNNLMNEVRFDLPTQLSPQYKDFLKLYVKHAAPAMVYNMLMSENLDAQERLKITTNTINNNFNQDERQNIAFMPHLNSYVDFEAKLAQKPRKEFNQFFYFIWNNAYQIPKRMKEEYLLHILKKELTAETVQNLRPTVEEFTKSLTDLDQMAELLADYEEARDKANGRKAPDFTLENTKGELVSLKSLQGNKIHLAFWSSTCKPCIEGMNKSIHNKSLLKDENIIFLYVSTDLTKATWLANKLVKSAGPNDLHLWIGKSQPELHEYNAITLPTYYFIDERGNFMTRFPKSWDVEFVDFVVNQ